MLLRLLMPLRLPQNTIAILFLFDVDNMAYAFGLHEKTRARVEKDARIMLTAAETEELKRIRQAHLPMVVLFMGLSCTRLLPATPRRSSLCRLSASRLRDSPRRSRKSRSKLRCWHSGKLRVPSWALVSSTRRQ